MDNLVFMTIITARKKKDDIVELLSEVNAQMISSVYTRDCIDCNLIRYAFGLVPDDEEVLIHGLLTDDAADAVFQVLYEKFNFKKPKVGVAFSVRVDQLRMKTV